MILSRNTQPSRILSARLKKFAGRLLVVSSLISPAAFGAAGPQQLHGHVPAAVRSLPSLGRLDGAKQLELVIGLPLRNQDALTNLLRDIYDPASTNFHHYLTPQEFTERFGPTQTDYQALADFARSNGLTVSRTHLNRMLLNVRGPVAAIENALHLHLLVYQHPTEQRVFFAPDAEPSLNLAAPVISVDGLNDFELPHPMNLLVRPANQVHTPNGGSAPDGSSYLGYDFRKAYVPGVTLTGAGQSVGLLEFDGYYTNDITTYKTLAGLPNVPVTNVLLDGYGGGQGANNSEVALDIEMAISMAPGLDRVIVYEGVYPNDILNQMANDNIAKQLSSSWTWSGYSNVPTMQQIFSQYAAQGQSYFNASGDSGAYTGTIGTPADDPNVTVVGGTTLTTDGSGNWQSETAWSWFPGSHAATSGGISPTNAIPYWQQAVSMASNSGSPTARNIPDVALTADNIWIVADNNSQYEVGGTSAATPLWAGFIALVNQQEALNGHAPVGFLNPALYATGRSSLYASSFHDITTGNNTNSSSPNSFYAVPGYDLCTGWGTPTGSNLINTLTGELILITGATLTAESCTPTNGAIDPGETVTMNFKLQNASVANTTNLVATLLATGGVTSPSAPKTYGALAASGGSSTQSFTFTANGSCGGTITATLQLQDGAANLGNVTAALPLGSITHTTNFTQNFDSVATPSLPSGWTTTTNGAEPAWVTTTAQRDTAPNSAFAGERSKAGVTQLVSPAMTVNTPTTQLRFRHSYNTDSGFDGGVLEIQIGSGSFTDIITAGGSFASNGYTATLGNTSGNPIGGRSAWTGNSGGFITTLVNLPPTAAGQTVSFRWRFGTDKFFGGSGWYLDTIALIDGVYSCCSGGSADMAVSETASTNLAVTGHNLTYAIAITNLGTVTASNVTFTDSLPVGVTFVSASPGCTNLGSTVVASLGALPAGAGSSLVITVTPNTAGTITNLVTVATSTFDSNPTNNSAALATTVYAAPVITAPPTNHVVVAGSNVTFTVTATGTPAPAYQWFLNATNPVGVNSSTLTLTNVQPAQAGAYSVLVTNAAGSTNSAPATLTVDVPPVIVVPPSNQVVVAGSNASFTVTATGTPAPAYQWLRNGTNPVGTDTNVLALTNVQPSQSGNYMVTVTNAAGATNSATVQLTVLVQPAIASITDSNGVVSVSFQSLTNLNYTLEYKNLITDPAWTSLSPTTPGNGGLLTLQDTNAPPSLRFYRIRCD